MNRSRRYFLASAVSLLAAPDALNAQHSGAGRPLRQVRVPVSATGSAAVLRTRTRLEFAYSDAGLVFGAPVFLRIIKDQSRLEVWVQSRQGSYTRLRSFKICGRDSPLGPRRGNAITSGQPEGFYDITAAALRPAVAYLGVNIAWPNAYDRAKGWTGAASLLQAGCASGRHFGLTDQDMEEVFTIIYSALAGGQTKVPLHIFPFQMNQFKMLQVRNNPNAGFWNELVPAWRAFEQTKTPPRIIVQGRRYVVR